MWIFCLAMQFLGSKERISPTIRENIFDCGTDTKRSEIFHIGISKIVLFLWADVLPAGLAERYFCGFFRRARANFVAPGSLISMPHGFSQTINMQDWEALETAADKETARPPNSCRLPSIVSLRFSSEQ